MSEDRWTLLVMGGGDSPVRQYSVSRATVRAWAAAVGSAVLLVLGLSGALLIEGDARLEAERLTRENEVLTSELAAMRDRVGSLESRVASLSEAGNRFLTLAGIEPIDSEVLDVGVGGPGTTTPESHPLWELNQDVGEAAFAVQYDLNALDRRARLLSESLDQARDSLLAHRDLLQSTPSILPTSGLVSSRFSRSRLHPIHHRPLPHQGVDIAAEKGTPIMAAAKGTVITATWVSGYGQTVEIDHGYGFVTLYGHGSEILVRRGQKVERGDVIARVGDTGITTSPHLHYEIRVGGQPVNPLNYVFAGSIP
ncbi:MAG TPA: M23 family metallopeptidase [Longimicrobiales bacterium]|nr:M23 family metallopeptidase [Longimicrobiales bacterium]